LNGWRSPSGHFVSPHLQKQHADLPVEPRAFASPERYGAALIPHNFLE
jgi:hypothetical protein